MRRNLSAYVHYQTARSAIAWLPIFFLYMSSVLSIDEAIVLESVYYAAVVGLEVPSGYLSDRIGRRPTLVLAMLAWCLAPLVFACTSSFAAFAAAQILMAAGMALNSGTDEALLFDTLAELKETDQYLELEGRAQARARVAMALAALAGGAASLADFRFAYFLAALAALVALVFALRFVEPPRHELAAPPLQQLRAVARTLNDRTLLWLLAFAVAMTVFDHVPYMFVQPYLELLSLPAIAGEASTPLMSGALTAVTLGVAAVASRAAPTVARRLGPRVALLGAMLGNAVVITGMGLLLHPAVMLLVMLRAAPSALWHPIAHGLAHPKVPSAIRATYFSVESLSGRLAFSLSLALCAFAVGDLPSATGEALSRLLLGFAAAAVVTLVAMTLLVGVPRRSP